jgi:hypothetical protein
MGQSLLALYATRPAARVGGRGEQHTGPAELGRKLPKVEKYILCVAKGVEWWEKKKKLSENRMRDSKTKISDLYVELAIGKTDSSTQDERREIDGGKKVRDTTSIRTIHKFVVSEKARV